MSHGTLYIISSPSGAGKSSLLQALLHTQFLCDTQLSISYTTRHIRPNEINGKHYFFISKNEFETMIARNAFLEYAKVFGHYYGTSRLAIEQMLNTGMDIFLDIDWQGAQEVRKKISNVRSIFILPPSIDELENRLRNRDQDSAEVVVRRMAHAVQDISHYTEYDYLIVNYDLSSALLDIKSIIRADNLHISRQKIRYRDLVNRLLAI